MFKKFGNSLKCFSFFSFKFSSKNIYYSNSNAKFMSSRLLENRCKWPWIIYWGLHRFTEVELSFLNKFRDIYRNKQAELAFFCPTRVIGPPWSSSLSAVCFLRISTNHFEPMPIFKPFLQEIGPSYFTEPTSVC